MCMSIIIIYDSKGHQTICMKEFDALKYPCKECDMYDCEERENYNTKGMEILEQCITKLFAQGTI